MIPVLTPKSYIIKIAKFIEIVQFFLHFSSEIILFLCFKATFRSFVLVSNFFGVLSAPLCTKEVLCSIFRDSCVSSPGGDKQFFTLVQLATKWLLNNIPFQNIHDACINGKISVAEWTIAKLVLQPNGLCHGWSGYNLRDRNVLLALLGRVSYLLKVQILSNSQWVKIVLDMDSMTATMKKNC